MAAVITPVTTPVRASRPRVAPTAPLQEGGWNGPAESPGAPKPVFRLEVPPPTPLATPAPPRKIIQRCDTDPEECGIFCGFDENGLFSIPGKCPICCSTGIRYIFEDDFLAEPDRSKHIWLTWEQLGVSTPGWVIGNLDLDWDGADPTWSHEEEPEEEPEEEEEEVAEEEPEEEEEEVDEQEDLYDNYDGEHGDWPCDD